MASGCSHIRACTLPDFVVLTEFMNDARDAGRQSLASLSTWREAYLKSSPGDGNKLTPEENRRRLLTISSASDLISRVRFTYKYSTKHSNTTNNCLFSIFLYYDY